MVTLMRARVLARRTWRPWLAAWLGGAVLAVANGGVRDLGLRRVMGEVSARQVSTLTLLILLTGYMWLLHRRWLIAQERTALAIGLTWVTMTLVFELGLGHYVEGKSCATLLEDYDITAGHIWIVVPLWVAVCPAAVRRLQARRKAASLTVN